MSISVEHIDNTNKNTKLMLQISHVVPEEFAKRYKENVVGLTPRKNSWLRRSIRTEVSGNRLSISWMSKYAAAQNAGQMTVTRPRTIYIDGKGFRTLKPGVYRFKRYTTPGTGSGFADTALKMTKRTFINDFYQSHPEFK